MQNQVIKISSNCLFDENGNPNYEMIRNNWAIPIKKYDEETGIKTYLKTSGAVAFGKRKVNEKRATKDLPLDEVIWLAGIGQTSMVNFYEEVFDGIYHVSQVLITGRESTDLEEGKNFVKSVKYDWNRNTIPASNYNDRLSFTQVRKDNSGPAVEEAILLKSLRVIFAGTYDGFCNDKNQILGDIYGVKKEHFGFCIGSSKDGIGGMEANLAAIKMANENGIDAMICNINNSFYDHINRNVVNTLFHANTYK